MSTTIDSKVVEMRFDNENFEKNARTSMSTLDKLKEKLNFKGASSGLDQINSMTKKLNLSQIAAGVDALEKRFSAFGIVGMRVIENLTDSMTKFINKTTSFFTSGVIQGGTNRAMNLENAHFQLQGLLKDEAKVSAVMKNVNDAVDGTAYSLDSAAKVASQLAASGYEAGEQMFTSLRAVAGVAAMTNSSYDDIGSIFTTVAGQGKLMTYQLQQLSFRGMNAAATLAEYLGVTEAEVRKMVTEGKIDFATFSAAMDDAFGEHAKKANETFTGAMSNVKASLARIGAEFISPLIEQNGALVKFLNALREKINEFKESIIPLANIFTSSVEKIATAATKFLKKINITDVIQKLVENVKLTDETAEKLKCTFEGLCSALDLAKKILTIFAKAVGSLFSSGAIDGALNVIFSITAAIGDMITTFNNSINLDGFSGFFNGISNIISGALHGIAGFSDSLSAVGKYVAEVIGGIFNAFKTVIGWITENISIGDVFAGLAGGSIYAAGKTLVDLLKSLIGLSSKINKDGILGLIFGSDKTQDPVKHVGRILDTLNESLVAFANGIKVSSLLAVSGAIAILTISLKTMSGLDVRTITKSLMAIGILFGVMNYSFKKIKDILSDFAGKGAIKVGVAMMLMAKSINILAGAVKKMAELSLSELGKGLAGICGGMIALTKGLKAINGVEIKIRTIIAIGVLAKALKTVGESLIDLGKMSWSEIARGLVAMGGALVEMTKTLEFLSKFEKMNVIAGSVGLLIASRSLGKIGSALSEVGKLSWNGIQKGLIGIGVALTEMTIVIESLSKLEKLSGIKGAVSLVIVAKTLSKIGDALSEVGKLSWNGIGKGLSGIGVALTEMTIILKSLSKLEKLSGIKGAVSLVITSRSLGKIGSALSEVGKLSWNGIQKGLIGIGLALTEMTIVIESLSTIEGFSGIMGAVTLVIAAQSLGKIGSALSEVGKLSWSEIGRGLTAMGGALLEIGAITGALGVFAGPMALLGSGAILIAAKGLGDIADALKKFGEMSWSEIGRGLTAMGAALSEVALGGLMNTLSGLGAKSISVIAKPLGDLADSVKKWSNVSVPENLADNMSLLAKGVKKFVFVGIGADAIAQVAKPLGVMADSLKKWKDVNCPESLKEQLSNLAAGIRSFSFAFMGGWSLTTIVKPLGGLAESVNKWNNITVPADLGTQLKYLADGIKAFSLSFLAGWSLEAVVGPLGDLATSVKKWKGVSIPASLPDQMKKLAESIKVFKGINGLTSSTNAISVIAESAKTLDSVNLSTISSGLDDFADSLVKLGESSKSISGTGNEITKNIVKPINSLKSKLQNGGATLVKSLAKGMSSNDAAESAAKSLANSITTSVNSSTKNVFNTGANIGSSIAKGIKSKNGAIKKAITSGLSSGVAAIRKYRSDFRDAGAYVAEGLAKGISSRKNEIQDAAEAIADAAEKATRLKLKINSPSKVFIPIGKGIPEGLIVGMKSLGTGIRNAANSMGSLAINSTREALSGLADAVSTNVDTQPTIQPILDLSNVKSGAGAINGMFGTVPLGVSANLEAINSAMNQRIQNGNNSDVISAINKLGESIGNVKGDTYNVNGVTYDDGSSISNAIQELVSAARIGRRA